jgi:hypothetical protein
MGQMQNSVAKSGKASRLAAIMRKLGEKIARLFEPEEVEVTFTRHGNRIHYTYTKVSHKQVA